MEETKRTTLVLGASENPDRVSNSAVIRLIQHGHPVIAVGNKPGKIGNVEIIKDIPENQQIDTVTLYLRPELQKQYEEKILNLHPHRIIFNPGTENPAFAAKARKAAILTENVCTLVMLASNQYSKD